MPELPPIVEHVPATPPTTDGRALTLHEPVARRHAEDVRAGRVRCPQCRTDGFVFVRLRSGRASDRLKRLLGTELDWHYTWATGGTLALIPAETVAEAVRIPSVTKARLSEEPRRCWRTA